MEGSVYLKARQEWDERYADLVLGKRNWQITAAGMMAITLVLAVGMVWVSTRSKFVPYVVEVDKLGYAIGAPSALTENATRISTDRMVRYELAAFIRNAREVITDPAAEHQLIGQVYSRARGPAYKFLENYYHEDDLEHDPFKVAQHQSVSVQIDSILPCRRRRGRCDGPRKHQASTGLQWPRLIGKRRSTPRSSPRSLTPRSWRTRSAST